MEKFIFIVQILISVPLIIMILMQNRGSGVSAVFGGGSGNAYRTKRGLEKGIFILTIIFVVLFVAVGLINLVVSS